MRKDHSAFKSLISVLRPLGRRLLHFPGIPVASAVLRRVAAVMRGPDQISVGEGFQSVGRTDREAITVLTANLWHDWPRRRRLPERLEAFAQLVEAEGVDVVLLQEVARTSDLWVDQWLAERLGMAHVYSRANGHEEAIGFEEGLAVFARFPLTSPRVRKLEPASSRFVHRLALGAEVETPFGSLWVFSVHLSLLRRFNAGQVSDLRRWVGAVSAGRPALIGGDFNTHESSPQVGQASRSWLDTFRHLHPDADGTTHEVRWPWGGAMRRRRLDYVFLQPGDGSWQVVEARHLDPPGGPHSDHRAVMARLKVTGSFPEA